MRKVLILLLFILQISSFNSMVYAQALPLEQKLDSIVKPYRSKAVLVDFWATWCGPCRMAINLLKPMKETLKDEPVAYLYITGESSPIETWETMKSDIHGDHIRLSKADWSYLVQAYNIQAIPTFFVLNSKGQLTFRALGFPGVEKLKEEINAALPVRQETEP